MPKRVDWQDDLQKLAVAAGTTSILLIAPPHLGRRWVPSSAAETMALGSLTDKAALAKGEAEPRHPSNREPEAGTSK